MSENHIRRNIKFLRAKTGLTQGEFGALFGVSRDNIASYERGSAPKVEFIARLVNYFQISYEDFIGTLLEDSDGDVPYPEAWEEENQAREPHSAYQADQPGREPVVVEKNAGWQNIPIYDLDATKGLTSLFEEPQSHQPVDYLAASSLPRCDGGIRISGDSMAPVVRPGDIVLYRQVNDIHNAILWGEMYLLSFLAGGDEYIVVKYLHQSERPGYVKLVSHNPDHAPKEIALSQILALGLVKMSVRINAVR